MPTYEVLIPCTMSIAVTISADDEKAAKNAALDVDFRIKLDSEDPADPEVYELETHEKICEGNVYYGCICDIEIEEI